MKIEIKLDDPKSCYGCKMLSLHNFEDCNVFVCMMGFEAPSGCDGEFERPQECIERHGE